MADVPAGRTAIVLLGGGGITVHGFEHQRIGVSSAVTELTGLPYYWWRRWYRS